MALHKKSTTNTKYIDFKIDISAFICCLVLNSSHNKYILYYSYFISIYKSSAFHKSKKWG